MGNCGAKKYGNDPNVEDINDATFNSVPALHEGSILGITCLDDNAICSCSDDKTLSVFNWREGLSQKLHGHSKAVNRVVYNVASRTIWTASRDLSLKQWRQGSATSVQSIEGAHSLNITGVACSSTGDRLGSGSRDYSVKIWDVQTGAKITEFSSPRNIVTSMLWSDAGDISSAGNGNDLVLQGSEDLCVRGWDVRQSSKSVPVLHLTGFVYFPTCMCTSSVAGGALLAAGCKGFNGVGCDIKLWDLRFVKPGEFLKEFSGHQHDVTSCKFIYEDASLISCSRDGTVRVWEVDGHSGKKEKQYCQPGRGGYTCLDVFSGSKDGAAGAPSPWYCTGDVDGSVTIHSLPTETNGSESSSANTLNIICKSSPIPSSVVSDDEM